MTTGAFYELICYLQIGQGPCCRRTTLDYRETSKTFKLKNDANQHL